MYVRFNEDNSVQEVYTDYAMEGALLTENMLASAPSQVNSADYSHVNNGLGVAAAPAAPTAACGGHDDLIGHDIQVTSNSVASGGTSQLRQANANVAAYGAAATSNSVASGGTSQLRQANANVAAYGINQHPQQPRNDNQPNPVNHSSASSMHSTPAVRPRTRAERVPRHNAHQQASSGSVHTTPVPRRSLRANKGQKKLNY